MHTRFAGRLKSMQIVIAMILLGGWYQLALSASPYQKSSEDYNTKQLTILSNFDGLKHSLQVFYPEGNKVFPVMIFLGGLNGTAPGFAYSDLANKLVSKGVILVIPNGALLLPNEYDKRAAEFVEIIAWMKKSFAATLANKVHDFSPVPDMGHIIVSGHSSGAQAIVGVYRYLHEEISGIFFMDPVDGGDPSNMVKPCIEKDEKFFYETPVLVIASGLGDQPGFNVKWWPACAPSNVSGYHFYNAFTSPKWYMKTLDYGHADMLDDILGKAVSDVRFCKGADKSFNRSDLRSFLAGAIYSFIDGAVSGNVDQLRYITDQNLIPLKVELMHEAL